MNLSGYGVGYFSHDTMRKQPKVFFSQCFRWSLVPSKGVVKQSVHTIGKTQPSAWETDAEKPHGEAY